MISKTKSKKVAVTYCRVSTDRQAKIGLSMQEQQRLCEERAHQEGYSILEVIKDDGKSAGSLKRAGMQRLMKLSVEKKIDAVFTVHSDRIARNADNYLQLRTLFRDNQVKLFFVQLPNLDDSASSKMMDTMLASINQYHRDITSEKVTMTMEGKAKLGYFPGLAPIGYKNITRKDIVVERAGQKIVVLDPIRAPLVKKAFELYETGNFNVFDICDVMFEKGLRTKYDKKIGHSRMYETLKNRFYIGEVHWGSVNIKNGKHDKLIDEDLFNRVQKLLEIKNGHACRRRKYTWLLNGFLKCYTHECKYTAEWHLKKKIAYYHCTNRNGCGKYIEMNKLEGMVADKFKDLEFSQDFIDLVIEKAKKIFYDRRKLYDDKKKALVNQKTAFETKRKVAEDKLFSDTISDSDFKRIREEITQELENIDNRMIELERGREVNVDVAQQVLNLSRNIHDAFNKASPKLKRQYLSFFWERFEVADGLIIKSVPSLLFGQLLELEKASYKNENSKKSVISNDSLKVIKSSQLCAR
ncbi:recombinase family protein [Candidatus Nomurabacteria bacterium]|nr:recombinase family protein [Candidatus Nomurabacteria bacterium]